MKFRLISIALALPLLAPTARGQVLVEAESFDTRGGWKLDTQFIGVMGSPYLLAHGLGKPVDDATTTATFPETGEYRVWVRTLNWVKKFDEHVDADAAPGRFRLRIGDRVLDHEFGATGAQWHWEDGGTVTVSDGETSIALQDLTGFEGRCDAILFSRDPDFVPDNSSEILPAWRREMLDLPEEPIEEGPYDIVFIGGGYAGTCGAISAARMGLNVALVQNRSVLGGNGSSEVRVWAQGNTPPGLYPVGDIVRELEDDAEASPGTYEEFEDDKKLRIARAEENLSLFLNHHAYEVDMASDTHIEAVKAFDTRSGAIRRFTAHTFCDSTGHGTIGKKAGADYEMIEGGRMGMSNMWTWENADEPQSFPETPWALPLETGDFPYPREFHAQWFWESGFDKHPLKGLENIRDWNLVASFGAWNAIKNEGAYDRYDPAKKDHANARLTWMAYIGGPRETLQLLGDVVLTEEDIVNKRPFPDGCVLTTWSVDLHYPKEQYHREEYPPFISKAVHGEGVDRKRGYPVPYRCFYSRNIDNLFMAGRDISVTHTALGTVRVMKTCGMMGVVVGKAAAVCAEHDVLPREVYYQHLEDLIELLELPGNMRREKLDDEFAVDPNLPDLGPPETPWIRIDELEGIAVDEEAAELTGNWKHGAGLKPHVADGYHYIGPAPRGNDEAIATARFEFTVPEDGEYEVRIAHQPHENRSSQTPVTVISADGEKTTTVNQRVAPPLARGFYGLGVYRFETDRPAAVVVTNEGTDGNAHVDAVQVVPVEE